MVIPDYFNHCAVSVEYMVRHGGYSSLLLIVAAVNRNRIYFIRGKIQYGRGNLDEAIKLIRKAVNSGRASIEATASYGFLRLKPVISRRRKKYSLKLFKKAAPPIREITRSQTLRFVLWKKVTLMRPRYA